jgi:cysteine synthase
MRPSQVPLRLIPDEGTVPLVFELLEQEGLCLGGSSGIHVAGAIRLAQHLGLISAFARGADRHMAGHKDRV